MTPRRWFAVPLLLVAIASGPGHAAAERGAERERAQPSSSDYRDPSLDGPSYMAVDPQGRTWAVWSYRRGAEVDIAVSRAIGRTWSAPEIIGVAGVDDLDPRIAFTPDGRPVVIWWQRDAETGGGSVLGAARSAGVWSAPVLIGNGTNPAVFVAGERLTVAFLDGSGNVTQRAVQAAPIPFASDSGSNGPDPMPTVIIRPPKIH